MTKALVWRILILSIVLAVLPAIAQLPSPAAGGPYGSALTLTAGSTVYAAAYCNDKYCAGGSRHNIVCAKVVGYHCTNLSGGYCTSNPC